MSHCVNKKSMNVGCPTFSLTSNIHLKTNTFIWNGPTGTFPEVGVVAAGGVFRERENVPAINVRGLELGANWTRGPWAIRAGASFTHARMETNGDTILLNGLRPAQTPNFAATLAVSWERNGRGAELALRRVGAQFEDDLNTETLRAATTLNASAFWPLGRRLQIVVRGENVTNALVMASINGDGSVERVTPRTLWVGLRIR